jgi:DNA-binding HxlR family transcriptional regulator
MPRQYDAALVNSYAYMHTHFGEMLSIFSQPVNCGIMRLLTEKKQLEVSEFKKCWGGSIKSYVLSRHLSSLYAKRIIDKRGKIYVLTNDIFYSELMSTSSDLLKVISKNKKLELTDETVAAVAETFSDITYDRITNILIHILLRQPQPFNEIVEIYRSNHEYISANVLRYHLSQRKFRISSVDFEVFQYKNKEYSLTPVGKNIHNLFDNFMDEYIKANEDWIRRIWSIPVKELVSDRVSMAQTGDKFYKVLRMLGKTDFVIVRSNKVEGIVTIQHAMSLIGKLIDKEKFWGDMNAREVMAAITEADIISGNETLREIYKKRGEFSNLYYVVDVGSNNYNVLDLNKVFKVLNNT